MFKLDFLDKGLSGRNVEKLRISMNDDNDDEEEDDDDW